MAKIAKMNPVQKYVEERLTHQAECFFGKLSTQIVYNPETQFPDDKKGPGFTISYVLQENRRPKARPIDEYIATIQDVHPGKVIAPASESPDDANKIIIKGTPSDLMTRMQVHGHDKRTVHSDRVVIEESKRMGALKGR